MQELTLPPTDSKALCVACRKQVEPEASICSECGSFQKRWRNELRYMANTIGLMTVAGALIVYCITSIPELRKQIFWEDEVSVLSFGPLNGISIANTGDGDVFLTDIYVSTAWGRSSTFTIAKLLRRGDVVVNQPRQDEIGLRNFSNLSVSSEREWRSAIEKSGFGENHCWAIVYYSETDPHLLRVRRHLGEKFRWERAKEARVRFFSLHKQARVEQDFGAVVTLLKNPDQRCQHE